MEQRAVILVKGRVQGVCFRALTARVAKKLYLKGRVENLRNGDVRIEAEGETENLRELAKWCRKGPPLAKVDSVEFSLLPPSGSYSDFQIKRS